MRKYKFFVCVFVLFFAFSAFSFAHDDYSRFTEILFDGKGLSEYSLTEHVPQVNSYSAYVFNVETGSVIYRKNQDDVIYPASTVKLMTAIVAYENIPDLSVKITASKDAVRKTSGSNMAIKVGEEFTAEQLLYGLLVTGANDAANVLAEYVAGSIEAFCELMNEKAKEIGAKNTHFSNPTGLHNDEMVTTARDIAIIARYFYYTTPIFNMSNTTRYTIPKTPLTDTQRTLLNRNLLISRVRSEKYYYSRANGMSFGSTPEAGECIITSATDSSGLNYICVVMSAHSENETNLACVDAVNLLKMCLDSFSYSSVLSEKNIICEIPVKLAVDTDYVTLLPETELKALLPVGLDYTSEISVEPRVSDDYATAPIKAGEKFGEAVVKYRNEIILGTVNLVTGKEVDKSNVLYFLDRVQRLVFGRWFMIFSGFFVILLIIYLFISATLFKRKRRYRRR